MESDTCSISPSGSPCSRLRELWFEILIRVAGVMSVSFGLNCKIITGLLLCHNDSCVKTNTNLSFSRYITNGGTELFIKH